AAADRRDDVATLEREARVARSTHHEHALACTEVLAQVGIQLHELDTTPGSSERKGARPDADLGTHHIVKATPSRPAGPYPRAVEIFGDDGGLARVRAAAVLDLD